MHAKILPSLGRKKRTSLNEPFSFLPYISVIHSISGVGVHRQCGGIKAIECVILAPEFLPCKVGQPLIYKMYAWFLLLTRGEMVPEAAAVSCG